MFIFEAEPHVASHHFALKQQDDMMEGEKEGRRSVMRCCFQNLRCTVMKWTLGEINAADLPNYQV